MTLRGPVAKITDQRFAEMKVLLIEENQHISSIITDLLRSYGFVEISHVSSADGASRNLRRSEFQLILCDLFADRTSGLALVREVRQEAGHPNQLTPIVFTTPVTEREIILGARDAGANEIIRKPFTAMELFKRIVAIVDSPRKFVATGTFQGPDRRRKTALDDDAEERRKPARTA